MSDGAQPPGFDGNMALRMGMQLSNMGGAHGSDTFLSIRASFSAPISPENTGFAMFMNRAQAAFNLNPSNPNGLVARLLRLLQLDQLLGSVERLFQGAQKLQHEYQNLTPLETPQIGGPQGGMSL